MAPRCVLKVSVGWDKSSKSHQTVTKKLAKLAKLAKFHFFRHLCRFEVGQLGQLHPSLLRLREGEVSPESSFPFGLNVAGLGRVFETIKSDKQSGKTKTLEQKLTKVTKEFRMKHSTERPGQF